MRKSILYPLLVVLVFLALIPQPVYALTARYVTFRVYWDDNRNGVRDGGEGYLTNQQTKWKADFDSRQWGGSLVTVYKWNVDGGYLHYGARNSPAFVTHRPNVPSTLCTYIGGHEQEGFTILMPEGSSLYTFEFGTNYCL